jgi:protein involved in polysaccharide export with SLBB domain
MTMMKIIDMGMTKQALGIASLAALAVPLAACEPNLGVPPSDLAAVNFVQPTTSPQAYILQPGDNVEIKFAYVADLNQAQIIRPDGKIALPLVHDVEAAGMTPTALQDTLLQRYQETALKSPELVVIVREYNSRKIYIGGEVGQPGTQPLLTPTTILQAILQANGFKTTARSNEVLLIRQRAGGGYDWQVLNMEKALAGEDFVANIPLAPRDVIYVPRSDIANIDLFVDQYMRQILPIAPGVSLPPP